MATNRAAVPDGLQNAGDDTDAWFVALMIDHHAGGADMAQAAADAADNDAVRELAERMAKSSARRSAR